MYPYLHDFINDLFGTNLKLPFPMFGVWVALAFMAAHYVFVLEMKRKEGLGLLASQPRKRIIGEKMSTSDYIVNGVIGFLIGFKILHAFFEYEALVDNPPGFIFSSEGNMLGGILGAALSIYLKYREVKKEELPEPKEITENVHPYQFVGNMTLIAAIAGILGAKLFHNLENIDEFMADPIEALVSFSGLSVLGGLLIGGFSVVYYARKQGLTVVHVVDACAPGLLLAYGVGRIGCQLAGDGDWGIPNDAPMPSALSFLPEWMWAYDYPNNVLGIDLKSNFISMGYESITGKAWPTPFYESTVSILFFLILWAFRKRTNIPGMMFSVYLIMTGTERFFIEKIRINPPYHIFGIEATQAEIISVVLVIAGIAGVFLARKRAA